MVETMSDIHTPFMLNVGGRLFTTSKQTLIENSSFFADVFFTQENASSSGNGSTQFFVDRDGDLFLSLLQYMRSGELCPSTSDRSHMAKIVLEADFFGCDRLLEIIVKRCYTNLHPLVQISSDDELLALAQEEFPTVPTLLEHQYFPAIYFERILFNKALATGSLPTDTYVKLHLHSGTEVFRAFNTVTYQRGHQGPIVVEPMVRWTSSMLDWSLVDLDAPLKGRKPTGGSSTNNANKKSQLLPVSFLVKSRNATFWSLQSKTLVPHSSNFGSATIYKADITAEPEEIYPNYTEVTTEDSAHVDEPNKMLLERSTEEFAQHHNDLLNMKLWSTEVDG